jgi:hypothetical protein
MIQRLRCLGRKHQWHNGWDDMTHVTVWTCKRCGKERSKPITYGKTDGAYLPPQI